MLVVPEARHGQLARDDAAPNHSLRSRTVIFLPAAAR